MTIRAEDGDRFLRIGEVCRLVGCGRSWIYARVRAGEFPPPLRLGHRTVVWRESEVRAWMEAQAAGRGRAATR